LVVLSSTPQENAVFLAKQAVSKREERKAE
jgi:hypothetical protein